MKWLRGALLAFAFFNVMVLSDCRNNTGARIFAATVVVVLWIAPAMGIRWRARAEQSNG